ncbi:MAG TPA: hypothetical protein VHE30_23205 [Polyangiaceae bacterium]|nr:hypothetical protein [Polyangiaceae bacterium]
MPTAPRSWPIGIAAGGGVTLVELQTDSGIRLHRIDANGTNLDVVGIPGGGSGVAFIGSRFLAMSTKPFWLDQSGSTTPVAIVQGSLPVAGADGFALWDGSVNRFDSFGTYLGSTAIGLFTLRIDGRAFSGGNYWYAARACADTACSSQELRLRGVRETDGAEIEQDIPLGETAFYEPAALACTNAECLYAWTATAPTPDPDGSVWCKAGPVTAVRAVFLDPKDGTPISPMLTLAPDQRVGAADSDGSTFVVLARDDSTVVAVRIANGAVSGVTPVSSSPWATGTESMIAFDGFTHLATWRGPHDSIAVRIAKDGTPIREVEIGGRTAEDSQTAPVVATDGSTYLVAWESLRGRRSEIVATRVTPSGVFLDSPPLVLPRRTAEPFMDQVEPQVAFDGSTYWITWIERGLLKDAVVALRMAANGSLLDARPLLVAGPFDGIGAHQIGTLGGLHEYWEGGDGCKSFSGGFLARTDLSSDGGAAPERGIPGTPYQITAFSENGSAEAFSDNGALYVLESGGASAEALGSPCSSSASGIAPVGAGFVLSCSTGLATLTKTAGSWTFGTPVFSDSLPSSSIVIADGRRLFVVGGDGRAARGRVTIASESAEEFGPPATFDSSPFFPWTSGASRIQGEALFAFSSVAGPTPRIGLRLFGLAPDGGLESTVDASPGDARPGDTGDDCCRDGAVSTGTHDAAIADSAVPEDASADGDAGKKPTDSGVRDAVVASRDSSVSRLDSSMPREAGGLPSRPDAGHRHDASAAPDSSGLPGDQSHLPVDPGGCGCRTVQSKTSSATAAWGLVAALLLRSRRRARV